MSVIQSDMCSEFKRYATFNNFQSPQGVWPSHLAQAGFFRSGTCGDHQVVCFACGLQIDVRNLTRQPVMEVHRRLSPHCSFVNGASNNQPVPNMDASSTLEWLASNFSLSQLQMDAEATTQSQSLPPSSYSLVPDGSGTPFSRSLPPFFPNGDVLPNLPFLSDLNTLEQPQLDSLPMDLVDGLANANLESLSSSALNGATNSAFSQFHTGNSGLTDSSQIFSSLANGFGGASEGLVTDGESVGVEGEYEPPVMPSESISDYISPLPPPQSQSPPRHDEVSNTIQQKISFDDLGIIVQRPKRQDMATYPKRLETFDRWQGPQISQSKECIAEAGFYYAGYSDCCRCFYCGGGLKSWESGDEPWIEHARWFTKCPYIRMSKGNEFIDAVLALARTNDTITMSDVEQEILQMKGQTTNCDLPSEDLQDDFQAENDMDTDVEGNDVEVDALESENETLKQPEMCKICLDQEVSVLYVPCGHLVTCPTCAPTMKTCPVCRQKIHGQVRVQRTD